MAIDFPNSPSVNDYFTVGKRTWQWDGDAWVLVGFGAVAGAGDITAVNAGTNLNGGGTVGDVTLNLDSAITVTSVNGTDPDDFADMSGSSGAGRKLTVSATQPSSPSTGDVWVDIS